LLNVNPVLTSALPTIAARQRQVVELIAAGCSNDEVGERLGISPRTAKAHADALRQKLASRVGGRSRPPIALDRGRSPLSEPRSNLGSSLSGVEPCLRSICWLQARPRSIFVAIGTM